MPAPLPVARGHHLLRLLGWICGHCEPDDERGSGYRLIYHCDDERFAVRGDTMGPSRGGQIGLIMQSTRGVVEIEVGYLIHRPFWRRDYATEAALACRDYDFDVLGRQRVISRSGSRTCRRREWP
jgi:RimJ/RimL family protein N-acetyltransferase